MGSVIDGEDVVQDTFARAFVAVDELEEDAAAARLAVPHRPQPRARPFAQPRDPRGRTYRGGPRGRRSGEPRSCGGVMRREAVETAVSRFAELPTCSAVW